LVESFGLDEAFLEVEGGEAEEGGEGGEEKTVFTKALDIAREIKKRVRKDLGLTCSVGIAPNKLLSKMASELKKPDGFSVIREKEVEKVLRPLPVRSLWGVGPKTEARLKEIGMKTVGELREAQLLYLERTFGPSFGRMLHDHSRGIDESPVVPFHEPQSISRELTFERDTGDRHLLKGTLYELTKDAAGRLRERKRKCRTVTLKIRYADFQTITRSYTVHDATDSLNSIWKSALEALERVEFTKKVRLVGVKLSGLEG
ncbi:MAG: DNA polymerase IV, partial [Thermodesulfobacteriota bacterium]